MKLESAVKTF